MQSNTQHYPEYLNIQRIFYWTLSMSSSAASIGVMRMKRDFNLSGNWPSYVQITRIA